MFLHNVKFYAGEVQKYGVKVWSFLSQRCLNPHCHLDSISEERGSFEMNSITKKVASVRNKALGVTAGLNAMLLTAMMTYAQYGVWNNATTTISNILTSLESALKSIVVPIAGCALIFCFIMMLVSQNQKKVETYRAWCVTIVICIVAIYAVPFIISLASNIGSQF